MNRGYIRRKEDDGRIVTGYGSDELAECEIWGILNVTPDSFSDGGMFLDTQTAIEHGQQMLEQGADVIDVGGESSRPAGPTYGAGADCVSAEEEARRVVPVVRALCELGARVSIDTVKAHVASEAIAAGATVVNDVSCGASADLIAIAARAGVELVLMHTRGNGQICERNVGYQDVGREVTEELAAAAERAQRAGVARERIWIDPGIGFAKTAHQSVELLARLAELVATGYPVLVGPSRKSFIAEIAPDTNGIKPSPAQRVGGTAAAVTMAALSGVRAVRVHDVALMRQAARVGRSLASARWYHRASFREEVRV